MKVDLSYNAPRTYRPQACCRRCAHCVVVEEYDDGDAHYCGRGAPHPRPPCGSVLMGEARFEPFHGLTREGYYAWVDSAQARGRAVRAAWDRWSAGRLVAAWGICHEWVARREE